MLSHKSLQHCTRLGHVCYTSQQESLRAGDQRIDFFFPPAFKSLPDSIIILPVWRKSRYCLSLIESDDEYSSVHASLNRADDSNDIRFCRNSISYTSDQGLALFYRDIERLGRSNVRPTLVALFINCPSEFGRRDIKTTSHILLLKEHS